MRASPHLFVGLMLTTVVSFSSAEQAIAMASGVNGAKPIHLHLIENERDQFEITPKGPSILGAVSNKVDPGKLTSKQKAKARKILHNRSIWQHFDAIDSNDDRHLGYDEMVKYFHSMHTVFDRDNNGVVTRKEAPPIMLRYTLSGKAFPTKGLTKAEISRRFKNLFKIVDKNKDGRMSVFEML